MELYDWIERNSDDLVRSLQGCVQIPSVCADDQSGYPYGEQVHRCLHYELELARELGFTVHNMDEQVGWCEYGQGEEMVAVLCHLDVVPEGEGWTVPPYEGRVENGRIYGRGTMDDKGPALCALYALKAVRDANVPLRRRVPQGPVRGRRKRRTGAELPLPRSGKALCPRRAASAHAGGPPPPESAHAGDPRPPPGGGAAALAGRGPQ